MTDDCFKLPGDAVAAGVVFHAPDGAILYANEHACKLLGMSREELVGNPPLPPGFEFVHADGSQMGPEDVPAAVVLATHDSYEDRVVGVKRPSDKAPKWFMVTCSPIFSEEDNEFIGALSTFFDFSSKKTDLDALQKKDNFQRGVLDSLTKHICVLDTNGTIVLVNSSWSEFSEKCTSVVHNGRPGDNYLESCRNAASDDKPFALRVVRDIERLLAGDVPYVKVETTCVVDGNDAWFLMSVNLATDGEDSFVVISQEDITLRKLAEGAVKSSEENYRTVFNSAYDTIIVSDVSSGKIIDVNPAMTILYGYSAEEAKGMRLVDLCDEISPYSKRELTDEILLAVHNLSHRFDFRFRTKDGRIFWAEVSAKRTKYNDMDCLLIIQRDITERKEMEAALARKAHELETSNKDLEQFAYLASHDLQEPLRTVGSFAQLLSKNCYDKLDHDAKEYIDFIVDGANRMKTLIDDLLKFSRVGTQARPSEHVSLDEVLVQVKKNLRVLIEESGAEIKQGELPIVFADPAQMVILLQNLISNSIKFQPSESRAIISIECAEDTFAWAVSVSDNGIGIPSEYHERIFGTFQRLHHRGDYPGTGMGLAICKKIVDRHGGKIWVESEEGAGSTFHFTILKDFTAEDV